jgi:phosphoglycerate dehydrogenase-like enzyme
VIETKSGGERNPLLDEPNVIVTPHIGGATMETLRRGADMAVAAITALLDEEPLPFVINPEALRPKARSGADG